MSTSTIQVIQSLEQGFKTYTLSNGLISLTVVPELGAKVLSLRNERTGREWMWHPEGRRKLMRNQPGNDFAEGPLWGWDECFPAIGAGTWKDRTIPDHGEIWARSWKIEEAELERGALVTSVKLACAPLVFERFILLDGDKLYVTYRVHNLGSEPEQFLWAVHPLFALQEDDRVELTTEMLTCLASEQWIPNLHFPKGVLAHSKSFAGPLRLGQCGIINNRTGDILRLHWDPKINPFLGIWITRGAWRGHHHLALEPTNGPADALEEAAKHPEACHPLQPGQSREWEVVLEIRVI